MLARFCVLCDSEVQNFEGRLLNSRYELKFPISAEQKQKIVAAASDAMVTDEHGAVGRYRVVSHYFDSPDLTAYWEKVDGEENRRKFRLRYYARADDPTGPKFAFMEIKRRINNAIYKERVRISQDGMLAILADVNHLRRLDEFVLGNPKEFAPMIREIERATYRPGLFQASVVSYIREAWLGTVDNRLRMTFDSLCMGHPASDVPLFKFSHGHALMPPTRPLMEIKIDNAIPRWLREIVVKEGARLERFSKYAASIEALGMVRIQPRLPCDEMDSPTIVGEPEEENVVKGRVDNKSPVPVTNRS